MKNTKFKKGQIPWNKEISCPKEVRLKISKSKQGNIPWNKGKKLHYEVWNKGTKGICKPNAGSFKKGQRPVFYKGWTMHSSGYKLLHIPKHPYANYKGQVYEHRLIIENRIGRYLKKEEVVHHINKIKDDNQIKNLILFKNDGVHHTFEQKHKVNKPTDIIFDGRKDKK